MDNQYFSKDDVKIFYIHNQLLASKDKVPVLLIHGFASSAMTNWGNTSWLKSFADSNRLAIAMDIRGHGLSTKFHDPDKYKMPLLVDDIIGLLDYLKLTCVNVVGYSMGARIAACLVTLYPERVNSIVFGGAGDKIINKQGIEEKIALAMSAKSREDLHDRHQKTFRIFAENGKNDLQALEAFVYGARWSLTTKEASNVKCPKLIALAANDSIAGDYQLLLSSLSSPFAPKLVVIEGSSHNSVVGNRLYKSAVIDFLQEL